MNVAILGAGNGGLSAAVELTLKGHDTRIWNRSPEALEPFINGGSINYTGVFGSGSIRQEIVSTDITKVLKDCDTIVVCLPTFAHKSIASLLLTLGVTKTPVILNPGQTGGALEFSEVFQSADRSPPPTAEFSTLTYVARKVDSSTVAITGKASHVWVAGLSGSASAIECAQILYPAANKSPDVIACGLANVNMVLHPPGAILGAAWAESTGGDFTFYVEGLPDGVGKVMDSLDSERVAVAAAFGHRIPSLFDEMQAIGTIDKSASKDEGLAAAVRSGTANKKIKAPSSLTHRYYKEDFFYGLKPLLDLADIGGCEVPVARSLLTLAAVMTGQNPDTTGRTARSMGIDGMNRDQLLARVEP